MAPWGRYLALGLGFIECVLFAGTLMGWSSLVYVLKQDKVFEYLCKENNDNVTQSTTPGDLYVTPTTQYAIQVTGDENARQMFESFDIGNRTESGIQPCAKQDNILSLAFTLSLVVLGLLAIPMGAMFDKFGLRVVRIAGSIIAICAYLLIGFTGENYLSWLIFPGIILLALACTVIAMTNCHVCILAGSHTSTFVAFYNGGINVGVVVFLLLKLAYDAGFGRLYFMFILCGSWLLFIFISTFILLPKFKVLPREEISRQEPKPVLSSEESPDGLTTSQRKLSEDFDFEGPSESQHNEIERTNNNLPLDPNTSSLQGISNEDCETLSESEHNDIERTNSTLPLDPQTSSIQVISNEISTQEDLNDPNQNVQLQNNVNEVSFPISAEPISASSNSLRQSAFSGYYLLYIFWYTLLYIRIQTFVLFFNPWITDVVDNDINQVSYFTNIFGYSQIACVLFAPFAGIYMDRKRKSLNKDKAHLSAESLQAHRAMSSVPSLVISSLSSIILSALVLVPSLVAVYFTLVMSEINRAFLYATAVAYVELVFPANCYGRLLGISYFVSGIATLVQYPASIWVSTYGFFQIHVVMLIMVVLTLLHPIYLIYKYKKFRTTRTNTPHHQ